MAFERYITKSGKLVIAVRIYHSVVIVNKKVIATSPTTIELLNVEKEEAKEVKYVEFEEMLLSGKLRRVTN